LSPIRQRFNVESYEKRENEESMTHSTTTTTTSTARAMGNGNKKSVSHSFSADHFKRDSSKFPNNTDVAKWSSTEVQRWLLEQCKQFELKKATAEKFQMNGKKNMLIAIFHDHFIFRSSFSITY
jgi:hypothetical protein